MRTNRTLPVVLYTLIITLLTLSGLTTKAAVLADTRVDFSGTQNPFSWQYGYRDYTADGGASENYLTTDFVSFPGGDGFGV